MALSYNRISHVVMMASPKDLRDFALGFSITEGLMESPEELLAAKIIPRNPGIEVALSVSEDCYERVQGQRRNLTGRTGCGLCGAESLEQAMRYPAPVNMSTLTTHQALQKAIQSLSQHQPLQEITGAVHGAAWCSLDGEILTLREDVGRHNALDKLIGHLFHSGFSPMDGFVLVSSRASYEMVYKTAAAGVEVMAAVSAPTALAIDFANQAGLTLVGFARPGRHNIYTFPQRISGG